MGTTMDFFQKLGDFLAKLQTTIQLTGLIITVAGFLVVKAIVPDQPLAQITAGSTGVLFIVFGQCFHFLHLIQESERSKYIITLFFGFLFFSLTLVIITVSLTSTGMSNTANIKLIEAAKTLREEYKRVLDAHSPTFTNTDFERAQENLILIRQLDIDNGHLHYYRGEIKRKLGRKIESHADFFRYLEVEKSLPESKQDERLDAEICYQRADGYCRQRTGWICHLLANDSFEEAKQTKDLDLQQKYLIDALSYVDCVFKKYPDGFSDPNQFTPTSVLKKEIEKRRITYTHSVGKN